MTPVTIDLLHDLARFFAWRPALHRSIACFRDSAFRTRVQLTAFDKATAVKPSLSLRPGKPDTTYEGFRKTVSGLSIEWQSGVTTCAPRTDQIDPDNVELVIQVHEKCASLNEGE
jgi:hypothetical protein